MLDKSEFLKKKKKTTTTKKHCNFMQLSFFISFGKHFFFNYRTGNARKRMSYSRQLVIVILCQLSVDNSHLGLHTYDEGNMNLLIKTNIS